jgi:hypothetical protein
MRAETERDSRKLPTRVMGDKPNGKSQRKNVEAGNLGLIDFTNFVVVIRKKLRSSAAAIAFPTPPR